MPKRYKQTYTYHGIVDIPIFNGYIFNHGTESSMNERTANHRNDCAGESLLYEVIYEASDRLFGTDVISPSTDKEYVKRIAERLNTKYLKNSPEKVLLLKDWFSTLGVLSSIQRGYYDAIRKANLSETECIFIPTGITREQLQEAVEFVNKDWFFTTKSIRVSAKAYKDKTVNEKKTAAKPMPEKALPYILNQLRRGKKFVERFSQKSAIIQSILYAWTLINQPDFGNLKKIKVLITADDKERYENLYNILAVDPRIELINCESDADVIEEYKNMEIETDIVLMNPPYNGNLHLKILEETLNTVKPDCIVMNISPTRWLQDVKAQDKSSSDYNTFKLTIYDKIKAVKPITAREGNDYFGIVSGTDLGIYTFDINSNNTFSGLIPSLMTTKILPKLQTLPKDRIEENKQDGWRVRFPQILSGGKSGGKGGKKWYGLGFLGPYYEGKLNNKYWYEYYTKNQFTKETPYITKSIGFGQDGHAAKSLCDSLETIIGKYITFNLIPDVNVRADSIMWLDDYSKDWTNKELCDHFGLTGYISDLEAAPGSDYEEILNFVKENNII